MYRHHNFEERLKIVNRLLSGGRVEPLTLIAAITFNSYIRLLRFIRHTKIYKTYKSNMPCVNNKIKKPDRASAEVSRSKRG